MSREHKFRAWDKEYAHMYTNAWPFEHLVYVEMPSHDDQCNPLPINGNKFYCVNGKTFYFLTKKHVELMEYTGLKDCKGQDIFEGDILRGYHAIPSEGPVFQVYWNDDQWDVKGDMKYDRGYYENGSIAWREVEVIGNIYKNKDLLKARGKE